jgi:hypothetical protein
MPDESAEAELVERLAAIVRGASSLMQVLTTIRALDLPDWLVMSGAVYQRVLNALTGRPPDYGVRDYDLGYFDASDISYDAEDAVIRRVAGACRAAAERYRGAQPSARACQLSISAEAGPGISVE